jgi:hypothetical protein
MKVFYQGGRGALGVGAVTRLFAAVRSPKIEKKKIFWRKIVIFHTKYHHRT